VLEQCNFPRTHEIDLTFFSKMPMYRRERDEVLETLELPRNQSAMS
jgi:hypothetical protein